MKLNKLLDSCPAEDVRGDREIEITAVVANSKQVTPGALFIATKDLFVAEAASKGAVAVVTKAYDPSLKEITQIIHPDPTLFGTLLAHQFYQFPARELKLIGVTGTSGKTTVAHAVKHFFDFLGDRCGLVGTVTWIAGEKEEMPTHTTPDAVVLARLFSEMVQVGRRSAVMEVSSHALSQRRTQGIDFEVGIFTNLSQDHLDYHNTMEEYAAAKSLLFEGLKKEAFAVVNQDDLAASQMIKQCKARILTYGCTCAADLFATDIQMTGRGMEFIANYQKEQAIFKTSLIGQFNVLNLLAAIGACLVRGFSLMQISIAAHSLPPMPGRLERIYNERHLNVFVDYAHKPGALENVLKAAREFSKQKVIVVYGCGGDRDPYKRPLMGRIAEQFSDVAILTSDNPRREDPMHIAKEVLNGCLNPEKTVVELDRRKAIEKAFSLAEPGDTVLITGRGHEIEQMFADRTIPFDDRKVAALLLQALPAV